MDLNEAVQNVIQSLADTKEFSELKASVLKMHENTEAMEHFNGFQRKKNEIVQPKASFEKLQDAIDNLSEEYEKLYAQPELQAFFNAVDAFNTLITGVMKDINSALESMLDEGE
ncbi:MAG: YlbF family regulator [Clostridiales bacterium]|jgi:cell fate (sporulation/competence/biofilm development) regulator YlbF (YheA/YmcA/DUF963 family)|nr:YlbF family regulator [Clostridiales bacterium]